MGPYSVGGSERTLHNEEERGATGNMHLLFHRNGASYSRDLLTAHALGLTQPLPPLTTFNPVKLHGWHAKKYANKVG